MFMKKDLKSAVFITALFVIPLIAMICFSYNESEQEGEEECNPAPITIENKSIEKTEKFKESVSKKVKDILNGDIILTVYSEEKEDFCYYGKAELINDGSDGTEVILIIHEDKKVSLDDVF